jgi:hypothetical protein
LKVTLVALVEVGDHCTEEGCKDEDGGEELHRVVCRSGRMR